MAFEITSFVPYRCDGTIPWHIHESFFQMHSGQVNPTDFTIADENDFHPQQPCGILSLFILALHTEVHCLALSDAAAEHTDAFILE